MARALTHALLGAALCAALPAAASDALSVAPDAAGGSETLAAAGFTGARVLPGIEVVRLTDAGGRVFHVLGGLDRLGLDPQRDRAGAAPGGPVPLRLAPGIAAPVRLAQGGPAATDASPAGAAPPQDDLAGSVQHGLPLGQRLAEAGFAGVEPVPSARLAEFLAETGDPDPVYLLFGLGAD